ncbi:MAG: undecaprenyldiphospho-muramoylpentapeptide beta-N-acetylglucosaminyltransferase [Actinomycetota bacterium]
MTTKKVLIAGGGTTGHVSPAIAAAEALRKRGADILYIGTPAGPECRLVPAAGFAFEAVKITGRGNRILSFANVRAAAHLAGALRRCLAIVRRYQPSVVLGTGGYVSLPPVLAAKMRGVPIVLHEQNSVPGLANRLAARFARTVAVSFPGTERAFGEAGKLVGNPVGPRLESLDRAAEQRPAREHFGLDADLPTMLIFGGSQGAASINRACLDAYHPLRALKLQVLHICGPDKFESAQIKLNSMVREGDAIAWKLLGYCDRMDLAYSAADLALCRSGASTIAELATVGLPAVLVPYPGSIDGDQRHNAETAATLGGARMVADAQLTSDVVVDATQRLLFDKKALSRMSKMIRRLASPGAAEKLADLVIEAAG